MKVLTSVAAELQLQREVVNNCRENIKSQAKKRKEVKNKEEWDLIKNFGSSNLMVEGIIPNTQK